MSQPPPDPWGTERLTGDQKRMTSAASMTFVDTVFSGVMRLLGRVLLLVMVCWLALLGLALGFLLLLWSLLRGRKPALRFQFGSQSMDWRRDWQRFRRGPTAQTPPPRSTPGDVIEGQAREIPPPR